jgi:hypothetical protein
MPLKSRVVCADASFFPLLRGALREYPRIQPKFRAAGCSIREPATRLSHHPFSFDCVMHTRLTTRIKRVALTAARPAQRQIMHTLRHHAARTRQLAQRQQASSADGLRAWLQALLSMLHLRAGARPFPRFSLHTLLPKPHMTSHALSTRHTLVARLRGASRSPRRLAASAGWFAFAVR